MKRVEFYKPHNVGARPWGTEDIVALVPDTATLKVMHIKAGNKGRLQKHHVKNEAGHLLEGTMIVRFENGDGTLGERTVTAGESFYFPPGVGHQEEAVTDCVVIEVSTPHGNDRQGLEAEYGMEVPPGALPNTRPEDVTVFGPWWRK